MLVLTGPAEAFGVCRECQPRMRTSLHVNAGVCPYKVGAPYKPIKCSYKVLALFECHCEPQQHLKEQRGHITNLPMNHHLVCMTGLVRLSRTPLHHSIHSPRVVLPLQVLRCMSMVAKPRFFPSRLDGTENVEKYRPGGFHPIALGEEFAHGRYRVIHKLGKGSFSTIWMARDQQKESGKLVALKISRPCVPMFRLNHRTKLLNWSFPGHLRLLSRTLVAISRQSRIILLCEVRMAPTYFSSPRLPAVRASQPCWTVQGEYLVAEDYERTWVGK